MLIFEGGFVCWFRNCSRTMNEDELISESYELVDEVIHGISSNSIEMEGNLRRRKIAYDEIMRNYDELWARKHGLYQAKFKISRLFSLIFYVHPVS